MDNDGRLEYARKEFLSLDLKHCARKACAIDVLAYVARGKATCVTDFTETVAEREQVYGFIENSKVDPDKLTQAAGEAALKRC